MEMEVWARGSLGSVRIAVKDVRIHGRSVRHAAVQAGLGRRENRVWIIELDAGIE